MQVMKEDDDILFMYDYDSMIEVHVAMMIDMYVLTFAEMWNINVVKITPRLKIFNFVIKV
jgi:hypothetical protein